MLCPPVQDILLGVRTLLAQLQNHHRQACESISSTIECHSISPLQLSDEKSSTTESQLRSVSNVFKSPGEDRSPSGLCCTSFEYQATLALLAD